MGRILVRSRYLHHEAVDCLHRHRCANPIPFLEHVERMKPFLQRIPIRIRVFGRLELQGDMERLVDDAFHVAG